MEPIRDEMIALIADTLLRTRGFRTKRRNWVVHHDADRLKAQACATAIIDHLERCGVQWSRRGAHRPHSTPWYKGLKGDFGR